MNKYALDYLMKRMQSQRDYNDHADYRGGMNDSRDYADSRRDMRDMRDYGDSRRDRRDVEHEYGRGGNGDYSREEERRRNRGNVEFQGNMDFADYHGMPPLDKSDMMRWKQMMQNEDGTRGPHYDMQQAIAAAQRIDLDFDRYNIDEKEFCMAMNMMYSDYCKVVKKYVSSDKEMMLFAELAKAFLCDKDGPEPSEKLSLYFNCIVDA